MLLRAVHLPRSERWRKVAHITVLYGVAATHRRTSTTGNSRGKEIMSPPGLFRYNAFLPTRSYILINKASNAGALSIRLSSTHGRSSKVLGCHLKCLMTATRQSTSALFNYSHFFSFVDQSRKKAGATEPSCSRASFSEVNRSELSSHTFIQVDNIASKLSFGHNSNKYTSEHVSSWQFVLQANATGEEVRREARRKGGGGREVHKTAKQQLNCCLGQWIGDLASCWYWHLLSSTTSSMPSSSVVVMCSEEWKLVIKPNCNGSNHWTRWLTYNPENESC